MLRSLVIMLSFVFATAANAGNWKTKDSGVGLIVEGENYDKHLNIVERGTVWDARELYENGAQAGKYRGNQLFAAWIQGPHTKGVPEQWRRTGLGLQIQNYLPGWNNL